MAFEKLTESLQSDVVIQAEMLFTHLPSALTRIAEGEDVEGPPGETIAEIIESNYFSLAKQHVDYIERVWKDVLPKAEVDYLLLHYTTVIAVNKGGN